VQNSPFLAANRAFFELLQFYYFFFFMVDFDSECVFGDQVAKPQWKAAIDFKWIRENKEAVAANIKNRNSIANLEAVLQLYDQMSNLQKVIFAY
jgi:hypothetical protein